MTSENNSKWFLQALGHEGLNNLLLAYDDKTAQAVCTFAYCEGPGHEPLIFEGRVTVSLSHSCPSSSLANAHLLKGKIVPARGPSNFGSIASSRFKPSGGMYPLLTKVVGWDPIFEYEGQTYAEMDKAKKNSLSHRALALAKLKDWLQPQV